ncbi:transcriptional regulator, HxlR family [Ferrithrix thermotolerans DSM 19514]|uniref:Transcriptional regulator, HxlR family n=2 Tax=Ferrithrix TaxID=643949 RepID=A0A1M4Y5S5_9ACTN|nr:transcriptional regulator, HxlR family [Ferrithrix thermotolerans DSM 19514]
MTTTPQHARPLVTGMAIDTHSERRLSHQLIALLGGRWTLELLAALADGGRRYQDLHDSLAGISHKVLTDTLRRAERNGLISRTPDPGRVDTATL